MSRNRNLTICIGASAGGVEALLRVISDLPRDLQATVIVATHRNPERVSMLQHVLDSRTDLRVSAPAHGEKLSCSTLYVGAADELLRIEGARFDIDEIATKYARMHRIDELFASVAAAAGSDAVGVVLSGMLWDGVEGLLAIARAGGRCIVQEPLDASYQQMPREALDALSPDFVGTAEEIGGMLAQLSAGRVCRPVEDEAEPARGAGAPGLRGPGGGDPLEA